jgi:hypothetical protein
MPTEQKQREFWSDVARDYDRVVDLQIGPRMRSLVRERLAREGRLGRMAEFGCGTFTSPSPSGHWRKCAAS